MVALRKESVDRNTRMVFHGIFTALSLSARRAWIEMDGAYLVDSIDYVSLSARRAWIEIAKSTPEEA